MTFSGGIMLGMLNRGREEKVFDWVKAARIIRDSKATNAAAGLAEDFDYTGGPIFKDGSPVSKDETYTYLASTWATPVLITDEGTVECYIMASESPNWNSDTYWPQEALDILNGVDNDPILIENTNK